MYHFWSDTWDGLASVLMFCLLVFSLFLLDHYYYYYTGQITGQRVGKEHFLSVCRCADIPDTKKPRDQLCRVGAD